MVDLSYLSNFNEIIIFLIAFIVLFIGITKLNLGVNKTVIAIMSIIISIMFISSGPNPKNYLSNIIPLISLLIITSLFVLISIKFIDSDVTKLIKILSILIFIIVLGIIIINVFLIFPSAYNLLPNTPNNGLDPVLVNIKKIIYEKNFLENLVFWASGISVFYILVKK